MSDQTHDGMAYRTLVADEVWYSLSPSVLPPDDSDAPWVDLHRHHEDGTVVLGRFPSATAAIDWAWRRQGVDPAAWRPGEPAG